EGEVRLKITFCFGGAGGTCLPYELVATQPDPAFSELAVLENYFVDRERVEEFVGEHDTAELPGEFAGAHIDGDVAPIAKRIGHFRPTGAEFDHREIGGSAH